MLAKNAKDSYNGKIEVGPSANDSNTVVLLKFNGFQ